MSSLLEIKTDVFNLNGNNAPGPFVLTGTLLGQMFAMLLNSFLNKTGFSLE